jgi:hypothetical protein
LGPDKGRLSWGSKLPSKDRLRTRAVRVHPRPHTHAHPHTSELGLGLSETLREPHTHAHAGERLEGHPKTCTAPEAILRRGRVSERHRTPLSHGRQLVGRAKRWGHAHTAAEGTDVRGRRGTSSSDRGRPLPRVFRGAVRGFHVLGLPLAFQCSSTWGQQGEFPSCGDVKSVRSRGKVARLTVGQAGSDGSDWIEARLQRKSGEAIVAQTTVQAGRVAAVFPPQQGQMTRPMYSCSTARSTTSDQRRARDEATTCLALDHYEPRAVDSPVDSAMTRRRRRRRWRRRTLCGYAKSPADVSAAKPPGLEG